MRSIGSAFVGVFQVVHRIAGQKANGIYQTVLQVRAKLNFRATRRQQHGRQSTDCAKSPGKPFRFMVAQLSSNIESTGAVLAVNRMQV